MKTGLIFILPPKKVFLFLLQHLSGTLLFLQHHLGVALCTLEMTWCCQTKLSTPWIGMENLTARDSFSRYRGTYTWLKKEKQARGWGHSTEKDRTKWEFKMSILQHSGTSYTVIPVYCYSCSVKIQNSSH